MCPIVLFKTRLDISLLTRLFKALIYKKRHLTFVRGMDPAIVYPYNFYYLTRLFSYIVGITVENPMHSLFFPFSFLFFYCS